MRPGLRGAPKANWQRNAYLHATEPSSSPEQQGQNQPTPSPGTDAGSSAVPGIVWESVSWHRARPCQGPFEQ